jgi:hypothetical protein
MELTMNNIEFKISIESSKWTFSKINKMNKSNTIDYELERKLNKKSLNIVQNQKVHILKSFRECQTQISND